MGQDKDTGVVTRYPLPARVGAIPFPPRPVFLGGRHHLWRGKGELQVYREAIEQELADAGWDVDGGFAEHLAIGNAEELSILVSHWTWQDEVPLYELYDVEKNVACWVWAIPTPLQAVMFLEEYGEPTPEEWDYTSSTQLKPESLETTTTMTQDAGLWASEL